MKTTVKGPCFVKGCRRGAKVKYECRTCESLVEASKASSVHTVKACRYHGGRGMQAIRRHALIKHPVNILRAGLAALKGEDLS